MAFVLPACLQGKKKAGKAKKKTAKKKAPRGKPATTVAQVQKVLGAKWKKIPKATIQEAISAAGRGSRWGNFFGSDEAAVTYYLLDRGFSYEEAAAELGYKPQVVRVLADHAMFRYGVPENYAWRGIKDPVSPVLTVAGWGEFLWPGKDWVKKATAKITKRLRASPGTGDWISWSPRFQKEMIAAHKAFRKKKGKS